MFPSHFNFKNYLNFFETLSLLISPHPPCPGNPAASSARITVCTTMPSLNYVLPRSLSLIFEDLIFFSEKGGLEVGGKRLWGQDS